MYQNSSIYVKNGDLYGEHSEFYVDEYQTYGQPERPKKFEGNELQNLSMKTYLKLSKSFQTA